MSARLSWRMPNGIGVKVLIGADLERQVKADEGKQAL